MVMWSLCSDIPMLSSPHPTQAPVWSLDAGLASPQQGEDREGRDYQLSVTSITADGIKGFSSFNVSPELWHLQWEIWSRSKGLSALGYTCSWSSYQGSTASWDACHVLSLWLQVPQGMCNKSRLVVLHEKFYSLAKFSLSSWTILAVRNKRGWIQRILKQWSPWICKVLACSWQ